MPNLEKFYSKTGGWHLTTDSVRIRQSPYGLRHLEIDVVDGVKLQVENRPAVANYEETAALSMEKYFEIGLKDGWQVGLRLKDWFQFSVDRKSALV